VPCRLKGTNSESKKSNSGVLCHRGVTAASKRSTNTVYGWGNARCVDHADKVLTSQMGLEILTIKRVVNLCNEAWLEFFLTFITYSAFLEELNVL